jgi:hypothetical protein
LRNVFGARTETGKKRAHGVGGVCESFSKEWLTLCGLEIAFLAAIIITALKVFENC